MPDWVPSEHPKQRLLFFVAQDINEEIRIRVRNFVERLAGARKWVFGPPEIVDSMESEDPEVDSSVATVGGCIELYSAFPGVDLPREVDLAHLEEIEYLVECLRDFSKTSQLAFEFELEGNFVGSIENGVLDRTIREGFLGEWRRVIERQE